MQLFLGLDIGSTTTVAVVIDEHRDVLYDNVMDTYPSHTVNCERVAEQVCSGLSERLSRPVQIGDIDYCVGTGYGRDNIPYANSAVTEIACHARGVQHFFPDAKTIVDIGGQDCKVIGLEQGGGVRDFALNEKCAAGAGRFLEVISDILETDIRKIGPLSLEASEEARISSFCVVFSETEVVSKLAKGASKENVLFGVHSAITQRVLSLGKRIGIVPPLVFSGGVAQNIGMVEMMIEKTGFDPKDVRVPPNAQSIGALGAALYAETNVRRQARRTLVETDVQKIPHLKDVEQLCGKPVVRNGTPVIGWTDLCVPVELISAAGLLTTRLRGDTSSKSEGSNQYMRTFTCSFIKNVVSNLLREDGPGADFEGFVTTNCCHATEHFFDIIDDHDSFKDRYIHNMVIPRNNEEVSLRYMKDNILKFKQELEGQFNTKITEQDLRKSIERYNQAKTLLRRYSHLLAIKNVPRAALAFAVQMEAMWVAMSITDEYLENLQQCINELEFIDPFPQRGINILLAGSIVPDMKFYDLMDELDCQVVYSMTSSGNKFAEAMVDLDNEDDIYLALARRCLYPTYLPRTVDSKCRVDHLKNIIDSYDVQGVIFNISKFSVWYTFESVLFKHCCNEWEVPLVVLESDFSSLSRGQFKTRIEAFLEMIERQSPPQNSALTAIGACRQKGEQFAV